MVNPFIPADAARGSTTAVSYDQGLREHMVRVFSYMGIGLAMTGLIAFLVAYIPALSTIFLGSPVRWVAMIAPFGILLYLNIKLQSMPASRAKTMFWLFCGTMGLSTAAIFALFTEASIARAFFITAATFSSMALWGYTTKKDLTSMGSFLMMGVLGILIASIVNLFMMSNMLQWIVSVAGVAIFTGLTAYDTQKIKHMYSASWGAEANSKLAILGALSLYLDFLNTFQFLLSLTGDRR
jgi:FtsH-binding integral membrane protein